MTDQQTTVVAVDAITGLVNMFKDAGTLYWVITMYSILVGAAMTYIGRRHFKKLLFLVGAFSVYVPMHYFASETVSFITAGVAGLVMVFCYPVYVLSWEWCRLLQYVLPSELQIQMCLRY